ncbi:hypothetical protein [Piscinibacter gummiphilus]|uniref:Uncharacterized protein n=1 Tax=Piscinibacter gummiphilus TaxID=946333 RepID=A0ABZ0CPK6_9BURK|nr:hypothetical protein [Piscinibacter gummiphilus]WOB06905.1 hypothetical protein RXV79_18505 [Piscinibacter gummiphilus]
MAALTEESRLRRILQWLCLLQALAPALFVIGFLTSSKLGVQVPTGNQFTPLLIYSYWSWIVWPLTALPFKTIRNYIGTEWIGAAGVLWMLQVALWFMPTLSFLCTQSETPCRFSF